MPWRVWVSVSSLLCACSSFSELVAYNPVSCQELPLSAQPALKVINALLGSSQWCPSILVAVGLAWLKTLHCLWVAALQKIREQPEMSRWLLWHWHLLIS